MELKDELSFISPASTKVGDQEIFYLSLRQILTFIERSSDKGKLASYLISEHGQASQEILELYQGFSQLLSLPKQESKLETTPQRNFGGDPSKGESLTITPTILAVGKLSNLSWNEVLDMSIAHYNLILRQLNGNQEEEKRAFEKARSKK